MNQNALGPQGGSLLLGWIGLTAIPLLLLVDSFLALGRGWSVASVGTFGLIVYAAAAWVLLVLVGSAWASFRRLLRRRGPQFCVLSVALLVGWAAADAVIAMTVPEPDDHLRLPGVKYTYEPDAFRMPGVFGTAHSTMNSQGIRGPELPPQSEAYRLLCVGGSTTECCYLDDPVAWPAQLMQRLNTRDENDTAVWVGAAGISDYASSQHLKFLRESDVPGQMDCVVVLPGINDLVRPIIGLPNDHQAAPLWYRSRLFTLLKYVWNVRLQNGYFIDPTGEIITIRRLGRAIPGRPDEVIQRQLDEALERYRRNLREMADVASQRGIRIVFVTQPVLWDYFLTTQGSKRLWLARVSPEPRDWEFLNSADLRDAIDRFNEALLEVAAETNTEVIDAARVMNGSELNFYDDYHLNARGCEEFATLLADYFVAHTPGATVHGSN